MDPWGDMRQWGRLRRGWTGQTPGAYTYWADRADTWLRANYGIGLRQANVNRLQAFIDTAGKAAKSRNTARGALVAVFDWMIDTGRRKTNPARQVPTLREPRPVPKAPEHAVAQKALAAAVEEGPREAALVGSMLYAGLRATETRTLGWHCWESSWLRIEGKGGQERVLPVRPPLARLYTRWRTSCDDPTWMFPSPHGGPLSASWCYQKVRDIGDRIGVHLSPHMLRHAHATRLLEVGADLKVIQGQLGHSNVATSSRYLMARPVRAVEYVDRLDFA